MGDLEPFKTKYLVLNFKNDVTRVYREFEVVNFSEIEDEWTSTGKVASRKNRVIHTYIYAYV